MADEVAVYTAVYSSADTAVADLGTIEQLHTDMLVGAFDAAVVHKENGKPHIVKRMDRPRVQVIPEVFGGGRLPRKGLKDAASELTSSEAGLIVIGQPTIEKGIDEALKGGAKVVKHSMNATTDEISSELPEALSA